MAARLPLLRVRVPVVFDLIVIFLDRMKLELLPAFKISLSSRILCDALDGANDHTGRYVVPRIDDVGRPVSFRLGLVLRKHGPIRQGLEVLRIPGEVAGLEGPLPGPW